MKRTLVTQASQLLVLAWLSGDVSAAMMLEPFTYVEDFEAGEENAWASYPLWQDTAYDPNFKVGTIVPGDPNRSIDQTVQPYTHVDNYAGAQKQLDMYLTPESSIRLRFYIKSHLPAGFFKIRIAAGEDGTVEYTVRIPPMNQWAWAEASYADLVAQNPRLAGKDRIRVNAIAGLVKIPGADPGMAFHFGLDDITIKGARTVRFAYAEPVMYKISEWNHYFPLKHYRHGDRFALAGSWQVPAEKVTLDIVSYPDGEPGVFSGSLSKKGGLWTLVPMNVSFPDGMYEGRLTAWKEGTAIAESRFTFIVEPRDLNGRHPRLLFDRVKFEEINRLIKTERYAGVLKDIVSQAGKYREDHPIESIVYDYDQFNDFDLIVDLGAWSDRMHPWGLGIRFNALEYVFTGSREAADYAIALMLKQCEFPSFSHPWMVKRGRHAYWDTVHGADFGLGYDLLYDIMDETQRATIRRGIMKNFVTGAFRTFVEDNAVTNNTSNWIAHIPGSALMGLTAICGDGTDEYADYEPYLTGLIYKINEHIRRSVFPGVGYAEGIGYYGFSLQSWSENLPSLEHTFNIDLSEPFKGAYQDFIWAGYMKNKFTFYFGDSSPGIGPFPQFAWLLEKYRDPLLSWLYQYTKNGETLKDLINNKTSDVPQDDPFDENPVRLFRKIGYTVFKSGWEPDDFAFVMKTGPFFNHCHFDQGTFWLADRGTIILEERHGSTYDNTPYYRPWYTKPIAHSTILVNGNHQSQRGGDPAEFAEGFDEFAFVGHFLDGRFAAFSSGDIGRLYWGEVSDLKRNVLYLKPRTLLMLDTAVPPASGADVDVTVLYQTTYMKDIIAGSRTSTVTKDGTVLSILHLAPEQAEIKTVQTPHYYYTLRNTKPLVKEGMLTVTARTNQNPLVIGNLHTTHEAGAVEASIVQGDGFVSGKAEGVSFAFTTRPDFVYETGGFTTDATAISWDGDTVFAAMSRIVRKDGAVLIESGEPVTCEIRPGDVKYYVERDSEAAIGAVTKPSAVLVSGKARTFRWDNERRAAVVILPAGEGTVTMK